MGAGGTEPPLSLVMSSAANSTAFRALNGVRGGHLCVPGTVPRVEGTVGPELSGLHGVERTLPLIHRLTEGPGCTSRQ